MGASPIPVRWVLVPFALLLGGCSGEPTAPHTGLLPPPILPGGVHGPNMICPKTPPGICLESIPEDEPLFTVLGDTWTWGFSVGRLGYEGDIELTLEGNLPPKVTAWFDQTGVPGSKDQSPVSLMLNLSAERNAPTGVHLITVRARGAGVPDATIAFRFFVAPPMN